MNKKFQPIKFPQDESRHNCIVEWWYFNGHLTDGQGQQFSFMDCLFKVDVKKVKIPFLRKIPLRISYFSHSLISDLKRQEFKHRISPLSIMAADSFDKPLLSINYLNPQISNSYVNCAIEQLDNKTYHVKNEDIDLVMVSVKKPLLEGGRGYLELGPKKTTYYYSLTNLETSGFIKIRDKWISVKGKSWMDHQWADTSYSRDRWDWFSIQLDNNTELVCCLYDNAGIKSLFADISYPDGRQEHYREVQIIPLNESWTSPKSQAVYPLAWRIAIPSKFITLDLKAKVKNQEMLFGSINYWEGPLQVKGYFGKKKVNGLGFMELVGYPSKYSSSKYAMDEINKIIKKIRPGKGIINHIISKFK